AFPRHRTGLRRRLQSRSRCRATARDARYLAARARDLRADCTLGDERGSDATCPGSGTDHAVHRARPQRRTTGAGRARRTPDRDGDAASGRRGNRDPGAKKHRHGARRGHPAERDRLRAGRRRARLHPDGRRHDAAPPQYPRAARAPRRVVHRGPPRRAHARRRNSRAAEGGFEERRDRARNHADPVSARDCGASGYRPLVLAPIRNGMTFYDSYWEAAANAALRALSEAEYVLVPAEFLPLDPRFAPLEYSWGLEGIERLAWCCSKDDVDRLAPWLLDGAYGKAAVFYSWANEVFVLGGNFRWKKRISEANRQHLAAWFERVEQYRRGVPSRPCSERAWDALDADVLRNESSAPRSRV